MSSKFVIPILFLMVFSGMVFTACHKKNNPAIPDDSVKPTNTFTRTFTITPTPTNTVPDCQIGSSPSCTPTGTPTQTDTPLPTATWTATIVWCSTPGAVGETGLSWCNSIAQGLAGYTFYVRVSVDVSVTVTGVRVYKANRGAVQQVGVYSDNSSGINPVTRLTYGSYTDSGTGWITVDVPDAFMPAGYAWLGVSASNGMDIPFFGSCLLCNAINVYGLGTMPSGYAGGYSDSNIAPSLIAEWVCQ